MWCSKWFCRLHNSGISNWLFSKHLCWIPMEKKPRKHRRCQEKDWELTLSATRCSYTSYTQNTDSRDNDSKCPQSQAHISWHVYLLPWRMSPSILQERQILLRSIIYMPRNKNISLTLSHTLLTMFRKGLKKMSLSVHHWPCAKVPQGSEAISRIPGFVIAQRWFRAWYIVNGCNQIFISDEVSKPPKANVKESNYLIKERSKHRTWG